MLKEILSGVIAAVLFALVIWLLRTARWRQAEAAIVAFLAKSEGGGKYQFRNTHAIASGLNMEEQVVRAVCGKSRKIKRNQKEKESWRLA